MSGLGDNGRLERIAKLRRERAAAKGKAKRARDTTMMLGWKVREHEDLARQLAAEIEELGGKVRR